METPNNVITGNQTAPAPGAAYNTILLQQQYQNYLNSSHQAMTQQNALSQQQQQQQQQQQHNSINNQNNGFDLTGEAGGVVGESVVEYAIKQNKEGNTENTKQQEVAEATNVEEDPGTMVDEATETTEEQVLWEGDEDATGEAETEIYEEEHAVEDSGMDFGEAGDGEETMTSMMEGLGGGDIGEIGDRIVNIGNMGSLEHVTSVVGEHATGVSELMAENAAIKVGEEVTKRAFIGTRDYIMQKTHTTTKIEDGKLTDQEFEQIARERTQKRREAANGKVGKLTQVSVAKVVNAYSKLWRYATRHARDDEGRPVEGKWNAEFTAAKN